MINKIKGYAKASRRNVMRVMALILAFAVLCAGTAFAATSEAYIVDIYDGSQVTRVETTEKDAYSVVADADLKLADNDKLILKDFTAGEDSRIIICRESNVKFVNADGTEKNVVFAGTVAELIEQQGVVLCDKRFRG